MTSNASAIAVEKSGNAKIGVVSATYVTQATCPSSCGFKGSGCYAESGMTAFATRRLNASDEDNLDVIALSEAQAIDNLTGKRPLRVHVVGDSATDSAARIVSSAMLRHTLKANQPAWTYTHAWRDVDHDSWNGASVQASCESKADVDAAHARGYATAVVVDHFDSDTRYTTDTGIDILPCPQQTGRAANCDACKLCMGPAVARRAETGLSIGFAVHGARKAAASNVIKA